MKFVYTDLYRFARYSCLIPAIFGLTACAAMDELVAESKEVFVSEEEAGRDPDTGDRAPSLDAVLNQAAIGDTVVMNGVPWRVESEYYAATGQTCKRLGSDVNGGKVVCKGEDGWKQIRSVVVD